MTPAFIPSCHTPAKLEATRLPGAAQAPAHRAESAVPADPAAIARRKSRRVVTVRKLVLLHRQPFCPRRAGVCIRCYHEIRGPVKPQYNPAGLQRASKFTILAVHDGARA